jgi:hypothetical protein
VADARQAGRRTLLEPLNDVTSSFSSFPSHDDSNQLLKASLKPIFGDRGSSSLGPSAPTSPTLAALAETNDSHPFGMAPPQSESPQINQPELAAVVKHHTPLVSASAQLSPGPGPFRCTFVLVDGIAGEPLSGERRHALRNAVAKALAAAHAEYPEAAAMLSSAMGLKRRAMLSPLTRTRLDTEDQDTIFESFQ